MHPEWRYFLVSSLFENKRNVKCMCLSHTHTFWFSRPGKWHSQIPWQKYLESVLYTVNATFPNSPGTTPLVAMALIDMAVSSVCKRRGKQLLHTAGNVLQSATGFIINESLSQTLEWHTKGVTSFLLPQSVLFNYCHASLQNSLWTSWINEWALYFPLDLKY